LPFAFRRLPSDDEWIAIDVGTDEEFAALCAVLGCPELVADPRFVSSAARWANQAELDRLIGDRTVEHDKLELFRRLQAVGVAAGPLQSAAERLRCPQLNARGFFEYLENDAVGGFRYPGLMWKMARTPNRLRRAPVTLGQDNEYVYHDLLGMSDEEYERRSRAGEIGTRYLPQAFAAVPS
jgi:crotonobetainyl-CoA:carnitine CoA-transferase CaiB-like acyl-CoA transferase